MLKGYMVRERFGNPCLRDKKYRIEPCIWINCHIHTMFILILLFILNAGDDFQDKSKKLSSGGSWWCIQRVRQNRCGTKFFWVENVFFNKKYFHKVVQSHLCAAFCEKKDNSFSNWNTLDLGNFCLGNKIPSWQPSGRELLVKAVACSVMENVTFKHPRYPIAQNAQAEPTLNEVFQLLQSVERSLVQTESILNLRIIAVETSLEVAYEKIEKLESRLMSLKTELPLQATENRKAAIMHELRAKEFSLLFRGIPMKEKIETSETSEKIICTFISEQLHFSTSNLDRIIFSKVHRLPGKTCANASSTSAAAPCTVVKFLTMKDRNSILNLAFLARQFKRSITKHLPLSMQTQQRSLLNIANKLYKQGKRIQRKIDDKDHRFFWRWASP